MSKNRFLKLLKKLHKWPAIIIAFFTIIFAFSGIVMNHRGIFSSVDVSRKLLPPNYNYKNWNLAAVRGSVETDSTTNLMFGNIGIWKTKDDFKTFDDFNQGFPKGIDNRKIYSVVLHRNTLFAGTQLGLYKREINGLWEKVKLPVQEDRIADLALKNDTLVVLTRHYLLKSADGESFVQIQLPEPVGYERKTGLFDTFWQLHSGELWGLPGKLIVDLLGLVTIILSITGLLHFFFPKIISRRKKKLKEVTSLGSVKKTNLRWHNDVGYVFVLFLIINTFSGMHLRPPLLIAIANKQVGIIPGTHLDSPNPWFDKLRRVHWDEDSKQYIFSTSEGFYFAEESLTKTLQPALSQPPVSVMGCNVLKPLGNKIYLVGSFSGMYLWNIETGEVADFFTQQRYIEPEGMQSPIGANMAAGFAEGKESAFWFDYNQGALEISSFNHKLPLFPEMTEEIRKASPMSLWNVALELHTGRIFEHLIGPFYILIVPIAGICILIVLISGFLLWWKLHRRKG
ncbi:MAG TPA: PepSY-associated TM helix domain-containing protein [Draconibacterium sp.]|nr:PepSY-associated TM helix domain-containing protein [Draconibacterium sp.]